MHPCTPQPLCWHHLAAGSQGAAPAGGQCLQWGSALQPPTPFEMGTSEPWGTQEHPLGGPAEEGARQGPETSASSLPHAMGSCTLPHPPKQVSLSGTAAASRCCRDAGRRAAQPTAAPCFACNCFWKHCARSALPR